MIRHLKSQESNLLFNKILDKLPYIVFEFYSCSLEWARMKRNPPTSAGVKVNRHFLNQERMNGSQRAEEIQTSVRCKE
jgi:hypothetical protein